MFCNFCGVSYRCDSWYNSRYCLDCNNRENDQVGIAPSAEDVEDELSRIIQERGTGKTLPVFYD